MADRGLTDPAATVVARQMVAADPRLEGKRVIQQGPETGSSARFYVIRYYEEWFWLRRFLSRISHSLEITVHPVYRPNAVEKSDSEYYCSNVQAYIQRALDKSVDSDDDPHDSVIKVVDITGAPQARGQL